MEKGTWSEEREMEALAAVKAAIATIKAEQEKTEILIDRFK